jgi:uncharacterized membrane protein YvlD (DUF360 family)
MLQRLVKGLFLGFPLGFLFVLLSLLIYALAGSSTNPAIAFLESPVYMFTFGLLVGIGWEVLPEIERESP